MNVPTLLDIADILILRPSEAEVVRKAHARIAELEAELARLTDKCNGLGQTNYVQRAALRKCEAEIARLSEMRERSVAEYIKSRERFAVEDMKAAVLAERDVAAARIAELEAAAETAAAWRHTQLHEARARIAKLEDEMNRVMVTLRAIAEGYPLKTEGDRYIIVENPRYRPDDGSDPKLVIDCARPTP